MRRILKKMLDNSLVAPVAFVSLQQFTNFYRHFHTSPLPFHLWRGGLSVRSSCCLILEIMCSSPRLNFSLISFGHGPSLMLWNWVLKIVSASLLGAARVEDYTSLGISKEGIDSRATTMHELKSTPQCGSAPKNTST